jgi:hypothetical protein
MKLWDPKLKVIIGDINGGEAIDLSQFYTKFSITKLLTGKPHEGVIQVYNLGNETEQRLQAQGKRIRLLAGYGTGALQIIYDGDIRRLFSEWKAPDNILNIIIGGNVYKITSAIFNKSYSGSVSVKQIIQDALQTFSLSASGINLIPDTTKNNFSFTGKTSVLLTRLLTPLSIQWYEDNGFIIFSKNGVGGNDPVYVLKAGTGLIGSPTSPYANSPLSTLVSTTSYVKVAFTTLILPRLKLASRVKLESIIYKNKLVKITEINYEGDSRAEKFNMNCKGVFI